MAALSGGTAPPPVYFVGRYITTATILPLLQIADGTYTKGTVGNLTTAYVLEHVRFLNDTTTEEISPANSTTENMVIVKDKYTVEVGEIMLANIANNITLSVYGSSDYFLITAMISPDGGTTKNFIQAIVSRGSLNTEFATGKSTIAMTCNCAGNKIAISTGTPTWT